MNYELGIRNYRLGIKVIFIALIFIIYYLLFIIQINAEDSFESQVFLNTKQESINAIEGEVTYPANLELKEIKDGNSIINFWVERPHEENKKVIFSGITPGGFVGQKGLVLSLIFSGEEKFLKSIELNNVRLFINDGNGTLSKRAKCSLESYKTKTLVLEDKDPPEIFTPKIANDPNLLDGKWFLVFTTQDKQTGVDYYEVAEKRGLEKLIWQKTNSPYLLQDQELKSYIYVKAVDKEGNERIIKVSPKLASWYESYWTWIIIIVIGLLVSILGLMRLIKNRI